MALLFESEICSRCAGSGEYSYCETHGRACFKCGGKKEQLTKRGAMAQALFREILTRRIDELKIGDVVECRQPTPGGGLFRGAGTVVELDLTPKLSGWREVGGVRSDVFNVSYVTEGKFGRTGHAGEIQHTVQLCGADARREAAEKALAYQASLTKAGKPRARGSLQKEESHG